MSLCTCSMLLNKIPFLRLLIPFVSGILFQIFIRPTEHSLFLFIVSAFILIVLFLFQIKNASAKVYFLLAADLFLFVFGITGTYYSRENEAASHYTRFINKDEPVKFIAVIDDIPITKDKWVKCSMHILKVKRDSVYREASGRIISYFKKSGKEMHPGQAVYFNTKFIEVQRPLNPYEFDYKSYLSYRQISHTVFADTNSSCPINGDFLNPVWLFGLKIKEQLLYSLKQSGLTPEASGICEALLTGYDDDIDKDIINSFSHTGTLHVLSVSGLHTGLIYLFLSFLYNLFDRNERFRLLKFGFITICLWLFALITGFSAPVLRAVVMFNLLGLGNIYFRVDKFNRVNILLVSAFMLLCYNPFFICDVGFLLSYFALIGIVVLVPFFEELFKPRNPIVKYLWQSVSASFAATITTLPFTLYYFKQFPLWFFVCNIVVVPATFVILILAVLVILNVFKSVIITNLLVKWLIVFINIFNSQAGYIEGIDFTLIDGIMLSVLIFVVALAVYYRSYRWSVLFFVIVILWQINNIIYAQGKKKSCELIVYNIKKTTCWSIKNNQWVTISNYNPQKFNFHVYPNLVSYNYPVMKVARFNFVKYGNIGVMFLDTPGNWPASDFEDSDILVLSNNFKIKDVDLKRFSRLKTLVADGSNNNYRIEEIAKLSSKFGIDFYSTSASGAFVINGYETENWR